MEELEELELRTRLYKLQNEIWFYRIVIFILGMSMLLL